MPDTTKVFRRRDRWMRTVQKGLGASSSSTATPSVTTKGVKYRPLHPDKKEIRVLRFDNKWKPSFRRLRLKVETLSLNDDTHEPYYCISYAWGENPGLTPILLDGREAQIPDSAEEALRGVLRHIGRDGNLEATLIWIDAVCINQDDLEEKSQQVAFMGTVFAHAELVFAWLGPDDGTTKAAIQSFKALRQQCHDLTDEEHDLEFLDDLNADQQATWPCLRVQPPSDCSLLAVSSFVNSRYFTRLWILQEIAVARTVVFIRGERSILWHDLAEAIRWIYIHEVLWFSKVSDDHARIGAIYTLIVTRHSILADGPLDDLFHDVLAVSFLFNTSNAWDKVYATLDIAFRQIPSSKESSTTRIVPDYEKPLRSVYQEASWIAMRQANSLVLLDFTASFVPCLEELPGWPSWVPRYHDMRSEQIDSLAVGSRGTMVSHDVQPIFQLDEDDPDILQVQGLVTGLVADFLPLDSCSDEALLKWLTNEWPEEKNQVLLRRTAAALVGGRYKDLDAEDSESILSDFVAFILENKADCAVRTRHILEQMMAAVAVDGGDATRFYRECVRGRRILFSTEDGSVGITFAKVSVNGRICIVYGCDDLFVLRQVNDNWKIKGQAYVPGTAKGEYVQQLQAEGRLEQETVTFAIC